LGATSLRLIGRRESNEYHTPDSQNVLSTYLEKSFQWLKRSKPSLAVISKLQINKLILAIS